MKAPTIVALAVGAVLAGFAPAMAGDGPVAPRTAGPGDTAASGIRILTLSGYSSRANTQVKAPSGTFDDGPEIVLVSGPGER